jgi:hypothetical protein
MSVYEDRIAAALGDHTLKVSLILTPSSWEPFAPEDAATHLGWEIWDDLGELQSMGSDWVRHPYVNFPTTSELVASVLRLLSDWLADQGRSVRLPGFD